jgi:ribosomal-protein-alanine N-acetyltransferase
MTVGDLGTVLAIESLCYGHPWSRGNFVDSLAAGYIAEVLDDAGDGIVGYFVAMAGAAELHLLNLTVTPAWQGLGHGRWMLDALEASCRQHGWPTLWLEVRAGNQRARRLYRRRGFAEVGVRRGYYPAAAGREDAVVMRLDVAGAAA